MILGVVRDICPGEARVAIVPAVIPTLKKAGFDLLIEPGAGRAAGFFDAEYESKGATLAANRSEVFRRAEIISQIGTYSACPDSCRDDLALMRAGLTVIGLAEPVSNLEPIQAMAKTGVSCFALELLPRTARAQSMDVLSSQATVAGYKAVLVAAEALPRLFPMLMTAAGTVAPAKVLVIGAGVAGLQAIATARRLGAVVTAYDIRPAVKEQVRSLGAKYLELELEASEAETQGGYAKAMDETFYQRQRELMTKAVAESDVVITTAAVPGKKPPVLITREMVAKMSAGSVIVDLAARRGMDGGNCELTRPDQTIIENGVTILGPTNLPSTVPHTASQMFARNIASFLLHIVKDGRLTLDMNDEITRDTLLTQEGEIVNKAVRTHFQLGLTDTVNEHAQRPQATLRGST